MYKLFVTLCILLIAGFLWQGVQIREMITDTAEVFECVCVVERERERIKNGLAQQVITLQFIPPTPAFTSDPAIPLSPELQLHTMQISEDYGVPPGILLAIMDHESGYTPDVLDNVNSNGTRDRGLCQINEVNWTWLQEVHGLDVSDPNDNIEAAAVLLSQHLDKLTLNQALAAYAVGLSGMEQGGGQWFAEEILQAGGGNRDVLNKNSPELIGAGEEKVLRCEFSQATDRTQA